MRLIDLRPRWLEHGGRRVAILFQCPCGRCGPKALPPRTGDTWVTCFFEPAGNLPKVPEDYPVEGLRWSRGERVLFYEALKDMGHPDPEEGAYHDVIDCKPTCAWQRTSDDFATMSITPSIDASAGGHWHGFVTGGEIR